MEKYIAEFKIHGKDELEKARERIVGLKHSFYAYAVNSGVFREVEDRLNAEIYNKVKSLRNLLSESRDYEITADNLCKWYTKVRATDRDNYFVVVGFYRLFASYKMTEDGFLGAIGSQIAELEISIEIV